MKIIKYYESYIVPKCSKFLYSTDESEIIWGNQSYHIETKIVSYFLVKI